MNWVTYWVENVIKFCIIKSPGVSSSALLIYAFHSICLIISGDKYLRTPQSRQFYCRAWMLKFFLKVA